MARSLDASKYDTDKAESPHYLRNYEQYFAPLVDQEVRLLELGVLKGGSLLLWRDYFPRGLIAGLDVEPVRLNDPSGRIRVYQGFQHDVKVLDRIAREVAPDGFDIIVDDCSHIGVFTSLSFWHLFDHHLKSGGLYVIEDWGTAYWDSFPDGVHYKVRPQPTIRSLAFRLNCQLDRLQRTPFVRKSALARRMITALKSMVVRREFHSHNAGMAGFIKALVDECGMDDITKPGLGISPHRPSKIREMRISYGHVFVLKA